MFTYSSEELDQALAQHDAVWWQERGEAMALSLFHQAAARVPAYTDFLSKHGVSDHRTISTIADFCERVPVQTKDNYIKQYSLSERSWDGGAIGGVYYSSSGTSGEPTFWQRNAIHDQQTGLLHEVILKQYFQIATTRTLFVDCFALGIHVAGYVTATAINSLVARYPLVSLATPGSKKEDILSVLFKLAPNFERVVLIGYPPLVKDVVVEATTKGFNWQATKAGFLFAAQGFSEAWRTHLITLVGGDINTPIINIYGSADAGAMGFETPLTIALRTASTIPVVSLWPAVQATAPYVFQYFPDLRYFETVNGELIFTADNGTPLIRYNIHDLGGIIPYEHAVEALGSAAAQRLPLPLVYVFGRSNYSVVFYGANIYPEHIQLALEHPDTLPHVTGRFLMEVREDAQLQPRLDIHIELQPGVGERVAERIVAAALTELAKLNREFLVVYKEMGNQDKVTCIVHGYGDPVFQNKKVKQTISYARGTQKNN